MTDRISKEHRSWNMSRIRSTDTKPEVVVRKLLHVLGYRFRLHGKVNKRLCNTGILPGKPDIVLAKYKTVIFVHGCFWHRHKECKRTTTPKTRTEFWQNKFSLNVKNDKQNLQILKALGWHVITIWECDVLSFIKEAKDLSVKKTAIAQYLQSELLPFTYDQSNPAPAKLVAENTKDYSAGK
ncbi:very short patch repair endonuclease [Psychromonas sp. MB-3u-54]|uniref:very short patch repair endonuclease n=1 Tax=Psychromonas sp. MB-3u-54 TaxID=2058319 RepID=UPI000C31D154|nr:very short patch repair endonuclease [Psychromonas sp. MB-3u-54]PKH03568.1 very short patch repair endonuclease [Psychromonas sp. MB-3u-54]